MSRPAFVGGAREETIFRFFGGLRGAVYGKRRFPALSAERGGGLREEGAQEKA